MADSNAKKVKDLENLILKYQNSYYSGETEITDGEFDLLWDELKEIAPESEVLKKVGSAGDIASAHSADGFPKVKHLLTMGSQNKASNCEEFIKWFNKQKAQKYLVQYKLDGASLELQYEKGVIVRAVTRGDGNIGDDITANALKMNGIARKLDTSFSGGIRGEVIMTHEVWKSKYNSKANCRNAATGIMRRKDGEGCENLEIKVYDAAASGNDSFFKDEKQKLDWLKDRGFNVTETHLFCTAQEIIEYREKVAALRDELPFDIDGLVVKDLEIDMSDMRKAYPEKQIAFKFELETAFSILREVIWSESGATYTPIGVVDPVRLAGTTVKRANLNNPDMIRNMGLKIGSSVTVVKRGEIIPKIEGLSPISETNELTDIIFPNVCNTCSTKLVDAGSRLYCPNPDCSKRLLHRMEKWIKVLDIREMGDKLIAQIFEKGIRQIHQLYELKTQELAEYDRMGEISASKVIRHIQTKRRLGLPVFVAGFDFEGIAETTMEKIALAGFDTLQKLRNASTEEISAVYGLGDITAKVITDGLKECAQEMDAVLKTGIISIADPPSKDLLPLRGMSFCFTGELKSMKRGEAEEKIKNLGAQAKSTVVKGLSYLVTNDSSSGSSKNKKANELGVKIINEDEFLAMLESNNKNKTNTLQAELF